MRDQIRKPKKPVSDSQSARSNFPRHYVAIGASAGGLEAIELFFSNMPLNSGLAFIVVQHLSPDYKSLMVELLSKKTRMKVNRAEDGMMVLPDNVYLIPPKKNLTIFHGKLLLRDQEQTRGLNLPIDIFLQSLAEDQGEKAIAVILSGTGSDGMRGVRSVKEHGGMVMVQDEASAKFNGMPRASISTGLVDYILTPDKMPEQLQSFTKHPYVIKKEGKDIFLSEDEGMARVFAILREKYKVDFTFYKQSTINRRVERRMSVTQVDNIRDYVNYLLENPSEAGTLYRELLIGVTSFFRDQAAFDQIGEKWLPDLLKSTDKREIRFWVAGCSTGEEAYTLAILIKDKLEKLQINTQVKVFATDIDKDAIQYAASGAYPESVAADIPPIFLNKYFYRKDDYLHISRSIREMVVFAQHNLVKDPPFTNLDFISCRNLLIYLQPVLQRKALEFFNFSLVPSGILFLGTSETTGDLIDFYEVLDSRNKIYRSKGRYKTTSETGLVLNPTDTRAREIKDRFSGFRKAIRTSEEERILERFVNTLAGDFIPLSLIVNEQLEVLHVIGNPDGYFRIPSGKLTNDISKMAVRELSIPLATGIHKVFQQGKELRFSNIRLQKNGSETIADIHIRLLPQKKNQESLVAVFLSGIKKTELNENPVSQENHNLSTETEERIRDLEMDLQFTRENLQATIEELETSNEELQATNEELLASNEELQSTNEELQSTNEELFTVNSEYQNKIIELTELHNDIDNLLNASRIGKLLLDENLEIRRFSATITNIFQILNSDLGRPLTHIKHNLTDCEPIDLISCVQQSGRPLERETVTLNGEHYLMRIIPYSIGPEVFSGTVLSFVDISKLRKTEKQRDASMLALKETEDVYRVLFQTMEQGVVYQNTKGEITDANPAAEKILGISLARLKGLTSVDPAWKAVREDGTPFPGEEHPSLTSLKTGKVLNSVIMGVYNPVREKNIWIRVNAIPIFKGKNKKPYKVYTTFEEIDRRKFSSG